MKFHPIPIIRYCYRYLMVGLFILYPIYVLVSSAFNTEIAMIKEEDQLWWILIGAALLVGGALIIHLAFWEKFFATLEITDHQIVWKCPFRKTHRMSLNDCVAIGACKENTKGGVPSECIYIIDIKMPMIDTNLPGTLKRSHHLIKYAYSDQLCDYLLRKVPDKRTRILSAYRWRRKTN